MTDSASTRTKSPTYTLAEAVGVIFGIPVAAFFVVVCIGVPLSLYSSWLESILWRWFIVPLFHLPPVSVWQMLALGVFVAMWRSKQRALKDEYYKTRVWEDLFGTMVINTILFLIGCGVHFWILR